MMNDLYNKTKRWDFDETVYLHNSGFNGYPCKTGRSACKSCSSIQRHNDRDQQQRQKADVKRIMAIMSMGVKQGAEVTVTCEGADEDAAAEAMEKFFKENL